MNIDFIREYITPFLEKGASISNELIDEVFHFCNEIERNGIKRILQNHNPDKEEIGRKDRLRGNIKLDVKIALTNEQLCQLYQNGNQNALDLLIRKNIKLVQKSASRHSKYFRHKLEFDDLVSVGVMGMMTAAKRFKIELENKFTTYAVHWIDQRIRREIMNEGFTIRLPVHVFQQIGTIKKLWNESNSYAEWLEKSKRTLNCDQKKVIFLHKISEMLSGMDSLNRLIGEESDTELIEIVENDDENKSLKNTINDKSIAEILDSIINDFSERERTVLELRFGLKGNEEKTLQEVGDLLGLTRERVRQIEAKALKRLGIRWKQNDKYGKFYKKD